jgi:hypothetical protein
VSRPTPASPAVVIGLLLFAGCRSCTSSPAPLATIVCDGELDEPAWQDAVRSGPFLDGADQPSAPYADARFLVRRDALYVALYAGDEDIRSGDSFSLEIGDRRFTYHPADHGPGLGVDMDGTLDDPSDQDEEWVVEARIGYDRLPHGRTPIQIRRCDVSRAGVETCSQARLRLDLPE